MNAVASPQQRRWHTLRARGRWWRDRPTCSWQWYDRWRRGRRRRAGDDRGSASVEFAITAVAVMTVIFTAIQAATWFWARSIALAAAQEGVNAQRAYNAAPGTGLAKANAFIASTGDGLSDSTVVVSSDERQVQVTVTGRCLSVIPGFCDTVRITATAHGTAERVTSP